MQFDQLGLTTVGRRRAENPRAGTVTDFPAQFGNRKSKNLLPIGTFVERPP